VDLGIVGQVALIVGGARGIGYATAARLAGEGAILALADLNGAAAEASASKLSKETGARVVGFQVDITNPDEVQKLFEQVDRALGSPAIVVNSAAILDDKLFVDSKPADWRRMLDVCLYGPMNVIHAALPRMIERRSGRVVCLASVSGRIGQARLSYYAAAKGGVIAFVKSVAQEVGSSGITLNVVSPGATNTELRSEREAKLRADMGDEKYARRQKTVLRMYPVGRLGEPDDIASAVSFLVSERASWITGQVLSVNGGFVMP
jgi:NAD(P)-dependent dehydrogenase (short-subunit alcohol dehydrogenase family)